MSRPRTLTEQASLEFFRSMLPLSDESTAELKQIRDALEDRGQWFEQSEWRISTWFESRIVQDVAEDRSWFKVSVECDHQTFSCRCPSVERAFMFLKFYQHLIVYQFYSVGPPWMEIGEAAYHRS